MTRKKASLLLVLLVLLAGIIVGAYYVYRKSNEAPTDDQVSSRGIDYSPPTKEQVEVGESIKEETIAKLPSEEEQTTEYSVEITDARNLGDTVSIRTNISPIPSDLKCKLDMSNGNLSYSSQVDIQALPSYATCKGFSVPVAELGSGEWNISVTLIDTTSSVIDTATAKVSI